MRMDSVLCLYYGHSYSSVFCDYIWVGCGLLVKMSKINYNIGHITFKLT